MFKSFLFAAAALFTLSSASLPAGAQTPSGLYVMHVDLVIVPADLPKYLALLKVHAAATIQEPGVIEFNIAQVPTHPNHLVMLEVYRNKASSDAHLALDRVKTFLATTKDMVADVVVQPLTPLEIHSKTP